MLIPHLHFNGDCDTAIAFYEKAFNTKVEEIVRNHDYDPENCAGDMQIAHARMKICEQTVFLNDRVEFSNSDKSPNGTAHLIVQFSNTEELLACYDLFKDGNTIIDPFVQTPYSELVGNFMDRFGILWGFMVR